MKSKAKELLEQARREAEGVISSDELGLDGLEVLVDFFEDHDVKVLKPLEGKTDPRSIRTKLAIFLRLQKFSEAAAVVRELSPHERWCDLAVAAFVGADDLQKANELIRWASEQTDPFLRRKCLLMYADAAFARALRKREVGSVVVPSSLTPQERDDLGDVASSLRPVVQIIISNGKIQTPFEEIAIIQAVKLHYLLGGWREITELTPLLVRRRPVPVEFARMVLSGAIDPPEHLADNLRADYPDAFEPRIMASIIESDRLQKHKAAFENALALKDVAKSPAQRERLYFILFEISQSITTDHTAQLAELAQQLLSHNSKLLSLARAGLALRSQDLDSARAALDDARDEDDPRWHQMQALFLLQSKNVDGAITELREAARKFRHPDLFGEIAELALRQGKLPDARDALNELLTLNPRDVLARKRLAGIYAQIGEFKEAAEEFRRLCEAYPEDQTLWLNYGICTARSNAIQESLDAYQKACSFNDPPLNAIAGRAEILKSLGRPKEAFESLASSRERFADDWRFLMTYMQLAHAAGDDEKAHGAFLKLHQLRAERKVPEGMLEEWSLDRVLELMGHEQKRHTAVHQELLKGAMPWLLVEIGGRRGAYWGWRLKTQKLNWLGDDPVTRAEYSIYATNSLHPRLEAEGKTRLLPIECPPAGINVVADLSAIITVHRLGMLEQLVGYFGEILIPSAYLSYAFEEATSLVLHQLSRQKTVEAIRDAIDSLRIKVASGPSFEAIATVDEHTIESNETTEHYRLRDVLNDFQGRLSDGDLHRFAAVCHHPQRVGGNHAPLPRGGPVKFALSSLETIASLGFLTQVLDLYSVEISSEDRNEVMARIGAYRTREEIQKWQSDLWQRIRQDARFVSAPHPPLPGQGKDERPDSSDVPFASMLLAKDRNAPLLVDDRMFQAVSLNTQPQPPFAAFGTYDWLRQLHQNGLLPSPQFAEHFLSLIQWRYRFLVPTPTVLKSLADKFKGRLPGASLQEVALYAQDCMRDAGLFLGPEPTEPPIPIGLGFYQAWTGNIAEFIMDVWQDSSYTEDMARKLTAWALDELLPSPPRGLLERVQASTALITPRVVLGRALVASASAENEDRANKALRAIAEGFHLSDTEYLALVSGVIDAPDVE